jgi:hypothetical protein
MKIKDRVLTDSNGNSFDLRKHTLKQAMAMSKMLVKCSGCHKASWCKELAVNRINHLGE